MVGDQVKDGMMRIKGDKCTMRPNMGWLEGRTRVGGWLAVRFKWGVQTAEWVGPQVDGLANGTVDGYIPYIGKWPPPALRSGIWKAPALGFMAARYWTLTTSFTVSFWRSYQNP